MIQGFNHNIKYRGVLFQIQTEDYGEKLFKIVSQISVDGKMIVTHKSSYGHVHNALQIKEVVRQMMAHQHKEVLKNLVSGVYEAKIAGCLPFDQSGEEEGEALLLQLMQHDTVQEFSPHLSKDQQKTILATKGDLSDSELTLDQLILSFLENQ